MLQTSKDLCFGNTRQLIKFKREVFSYHFEDTPDYQKLRRMLKELRDKQEIVITDGKSCQKPLVVVKENSPHSDDISEPTTPISPFEKNLSELQGIFQKEKTYKMKKKLVKSW